MEEQKEVKKILCAIIVIVIILGAIVCGVKGFNMDINYASRKQITIANNTEIDIAKIKDIANDILKDRKIYVKEVERFSNVVEIISTEITEEEKAELINKINEEIGTSLVNEDIKIAEVKNTRIRDIVRPYILPGVITFIVVLVYFMLVYNKLGLKKILLKGICIPIIVEVLFYSVVAIVRIPFGIITNSIAIAIYIIAIKCITTLFQNEKENISQEENDKKEND